MDKENALKAYQRVVAFTSEFCPNWSSSETAAEVDRLFRCLDGEKLDPADQKEIRNAFEVNGKIQKRRIIESMAYFESMLVREALENFYSQFFDVEKRESKDYDEKPLHNKRTFEKIERAIRDAFEKYAKERNIEKQIIDVDVCVYEDIRGDLKAELTAEYDDRLYNQVEIDFTYVAHLETELITKYAYNQILEKY